MSDCIICGKTAIRRFYDPRAGYFWEQNVYVCGDHSYPVQDILDWTGVKHGFCELDPPSDPHDPGPEPLCGDPRTRDGMYRRKMTAEQMDDDVACGGLGEPMADTCIDDMLPEERPSMGKLGRELFARCSDVMRAQERALAGAIHDAWPLGKLCDEEA